jgi:Nucleoside transporter
MFLNVAFITTLTLSFVPFIEPTAFFFLILLLVGVAAVASSLLSSLYGYASKYNPIYLQAFSTGQGLGGTLPSLYSFALLLNSKDSGVVEGSNEGPAYFTVAVLISMGCYALFYKVLKDDRVYEKSLIDQIQTPLVIESVEIADACDGVKVLVSTEKINRLAVGGCVNSLITLAIFPSITSAVESTSDDFSYYLVAIHFLGIFALLVAPMNSI